MCKHRFNVANWNIKLLIIFCQVLIIVLSKCSRHIPHDVLQICARFFRQPLNNPKDDTWSVSQPLGRNTLGNLGKKMAVKADLRGKKTSHSARKTSLQTLLHANVRPTKVMQLSRHKNIQPLNAYSDGIWRPVIFRT